MVSADVTHKMLIILRLYTNYQGLSVQSFIPAW
jgi:hypothetical protein